MTVAERDREIREIEHELTILKRRYANLDRTARWMRMAFYVLIIVLGELIVAGAVLGLPAFSVGVALPLIAALLIPWSVALSNPGMRWIDYVGGSSLGTWRVGIKQTEAMAVEHMVAEGLERLAALEGHHT